MANRQRIVLLALAAAVAVAAVVVIGSGGGEGDDVIDTRTTAPAARTSTATATTVTTTTEPAAASRPQIPTITLRGGEPVGGVRRLRFRKGGDVVFVVRSDVAAHVHLHGYDVLEEIPAGGRARFDVPADIDGRFEVELEDTATPIAEVEVVP